MTDSILDALAKPPPPPSELDELMSRDPLTMTKDDIDSIIAYQRQARAQREAPAGGRKNLKDMTGQSLDLSALGLIKIKDTPAPTAPTSGGGFRRM